AADEGRQNQPRNEPSPPLNLGPLGTYDKKDTFAPPTDVPLKGKLKVEINEGKPKEANATLEALIDQVLKAEGGEEKVRGLKTFTETIKYKNNQGKEVTEKRYFHVPDKYRIETRTKGEEFEDVYNFDGSGFKRWRLHDNGRVEPLNFDGLERPP